MSKPRNPDVPEWDDVRALAARLKSGKLLTLTPRVLSILQRSGREVAVPESEIEASLRSVSRAAKLLRKVKARIDRGSTLLVRTLHQMYILRDSGDLEGAREQMRKVLAVEVVPFYRKIAQGQLDQLDDWKPPKGKAAAKKTAPAGKAPARKKPAPARKAPARKKPAPPGKAPARKKTAERRTGVTARAE